MNYLKKKSTPFLISMNAYSSYQNLSKYTYTIIVNEHLYSFEINVYKALKTNKVEFWNTTSCTPIYDYYLLHVAVCHEVFHSHPV